MTSFITFLKNLQFIFKPSYWFMNDQYNKSVDEIVSKLLDENEFEQFSTYTAWLGDVEIWISNQPYACMIPYKLVLERANARPSRLTIQRGIKKLKKAKYQNNSKVFTIADFTH